MKNAEPIIKEGAEMSVNGRAVEIAREKVRIMEMEEQQAESDAEQLKQELMEAQLIDFQKESAEQEANQTKEQIEAIAER